ncbi:unnamed protein product [Gadus morhua 'NCC']
MAADPQGRPASRSPTTAPSVHVSMQQQPPEDPVCLSPAHSVVADSQPDAACEPDGSCCVVPSPLSSRPALNGSRSSPRPRPQSPDTTVNLSHRLETVERPAFPGGPQSDSPKCTTAPYQLGASALTGSGQTGRGTHAHDVPAPTAHMVPHSSCVRARPPQHASGPSWTGAFVCLRTPPWSPRSGPEEQRSTALPGGRHGPAASSPVALPQC